MADWDKIFGTISNVLKAGSQIYSTTIIAQAQVGLYDTQKQSLNTQISILKDNALAQKENTETAKRVNQIKNKITYGEFINEEDYNFLVGLGYDIGMSYQQYIDYISNDGSTQQEIKSDEQKQTNIKPYLLLGSLGLIGTYFILKGRK